MYEVHFHTHTLSSEDILPTEENTNQMFSMLNKGTIKPVIDSVFEFSNHVKQAYEHLNTSRVKGKIVIDFDK